MGIIQSSPAPAPLPPTPTYLNDVAITTSEQCGRCDLKINNGLSISSVKMLYDKSTLERSLNTPKNVLTLLPSIPFAYSYNGQTVSVDKMQLLHPCPVRIENQQYDAAFVIASADRKFVIVVPLQGVSVPNQQADSFMNRVTSFIPEFQAQLQRRIQEQRQKPPPSDEYATKEFMYVNTGNDWSLTSILPMTGGTDGNPTSQGAFFAWARSGDPSLDLQIQQIRSINVFRHWLGQPELPYPDTDLQTVILMEKPLQIGALTMSNINLLETSEVPSGFVSSSVKYKSSICASGSPKRETFVSGPGYNPFQTAPANPIDTNLLFTVFLSLLAAVAGFIGIYFAVKYAASPAGEALKKFAESMGRAIAKVKIPEPPFDRKETARRAVLKPESRKEPEMTSTQENTAMKEFEKMELQTAQKRLAVPVSDKEVQDKLKEGEDFAFKNPLANRRRTQRNKPSNDDGAGTGLFSKEELNKKQMLSELLSKRRRLGPRRIIEWEKDVGGRTRRRRRH
jgi:hypothetical protein